MHRCAPNKGKHYLHKYVKRAFQLTNKTRRHAAIQMVLAEQISALIFPLEAEQKASRRDGTRRKRVRKRGRLREAGDVANELNFPKLCRALQCRASDCIILQSGIWLSENASRKPDGRRQTLWETAELKGISWYEWVRCRVSDESERFGRARAVVASLNASLRRTVVFEQAEPVTQAPDFPFVAYGCTRPRWVHEQGCVHADLEAVDLSAISMVLCVEHDWDACVARNGLTDFPSTHAVGAEDLNQWRFFTDVFAC